MVHVRAYTKISHQEVLSKHEMGLLMHNSCESKQGCFPKRLPNSGFLMVTPAATCSSLYFSLQFHELFPQI